MLAPRIRLAACEKIQGNPHGCPFQTIPDQVYFPSRGSEWFGDAPWLPNLPLESPVTMQISSEPPLLTAEGEALGTELPSAAQIGFCSLLHFSDIAAKDGGDLLNVSGASASQSPCVSMKHWFSTLTSWELPKGRVRNAHHQASEIFMH